MPEISSVDDENVSVINLLSVLKAVANKRLNECTKGDIKCHGNESTQVRLHCRS